MSQKLKVQWCNDVPLETIALADRRTRDMVYHYGRNIVLMPITCLATSAYLQGVRDCFQYLQNHKDD